MLSENQKKILFGTLFLAIVSFAGFLIYYIFFRSLIAPQAPALPDATTTTGILPIAGPGGSQNATSSAAVGLPAALPTGGEKANEIAVGGLTKTVSLGDFQSVDPALGVNGQDIQFYNKKDGLFYRLDQDGQAVQLSDQVFHNVSRVTWSPQKNTAILEYPDGSNIVYDFARKKQITLPKHWEDFAFSPAGDSIVLKSLGLDPNNRFLAVSNLDGSRAKIIEPMGDNSANVYPAWSPNNQVVAVFTEGIDFDRQNVFFVGLNDENFKSMVVEGRGFQPLWTPAGDKLLYSVYSSATDMKPNLWIAEAQGEKIGSGRRNLGLATWAQKCAFADNTEVICAVPTELPTGAGLAPEIAQTIPDRLYRINTTSGLKKMIAVPDENFNMKNLIISENGRYLYFTDANSGQIRQIKLK
ncbi:hypothetical protein COX69_00700 [Candidatus Falkowbacteria bacterium CG_4_10_14_0_2_um_filter_48_10]|uniref:Dipeptidylpeptidase IV N-terminal domain-containing protein n=1 Tax=Candidatus Falkowbacteria bacterium CG23_combo_of_CG06-09_8_20_14_all_49_15 TaxID=1974572 RepID=A0A2G9ZKB0_9BACT|nr:MAG: hypothetical protein COX22_03345 [Candidatus Falkowbacteria bacterium CG23_combo_of_CG06-09_8_20_14_all_49_15]PJA09080.1 MAG: hypothetical protein COX69_00700 [Candidatus Falkowbacteria bacterium CG_4_10_14_0_2_um_filter_48_10]